MKTQQTSLLNTYASLSTRLEAWNIKMLGFLQTNFSGLPPSFSSLLFFFQCSPPPYVSKDGLS